MMWKNLNRIKIKTSTTTFSKKAMRKESIELPKNFKDLSIHSDFLEIINTRHSSRVYTQEPMSLLELSYILWTCQGVKQLRGKHYATLRTVPSGGARHGFELYFVCQNVKVYNMEPIIIYRWNIVLSFESD